MSRDSIRQRVAAATDGPCYIVRGERAQPGDPYGDWLVWSTKHRYVGDIYHESDAAFIAHARQDIPALLEALDAAERSLRHAEHLECQFVWCKEFRAALAALAALP